jgi:hypothetical protein
MGCTRWTYEPEEAVLKSAPRMDWVERLLFFSPILLLDLIPPRRDSQYPDHHSVWRSAGMMVRIAAVSGTAENVENQCYGLVFRSELLFL